MQRARLRPDPRIAPSCGKEFLQSCEAFPVFLLENMGGRPEDILQPRQRMSYAPPMATENLEAHIVSCLCTAHGTSHTCTLKMSMVNLRAKLGVCLSVLLKTEFWFSQVPGKVSNTEPQRSFEICSPLGGICAFLDHCLSACVAEHGAVTKNVAERTSLQTNQGPR